MCPQLLSAPGSGLPEGCSSCSPHRKLDPGSAHWEAFGAPAKRCSCCRRLCKVTSDCFPFQRQPLWKKLSPRRETGDGWEPGASVDGKGLLGLQGRSLGLLHTLTLQVFRGATARTGLQGVPAVVQSPAGVEHGFASRLRPAWARARLRARRDLDGGDSFMEQRPSARASCSSASSSSSC